MKQSLVVLIVSMFITFGFGIGEANAEECWECYENFTLGLGQVAACCQGQDCAQYNDPDNNWKLSDDDLLPANPSGLAATITVVAKTAVTPLVVVVAQAAVHGSNLVVTPGMTMYAARVAMGTVHQSAASVTR